MRQPELQRVSSSQECQFVHEGFPGENVGCGRESSIRALAEWRLGSNRGAPRFDRAIWRFDGRASRVDIDEIPGRKFALVIEGRFGIDDPRRPEIGPGEL